MGRRKKSLSSRKSHDAGASYGMVIVPLCLGEHDNVAYNNIARVMKKGHINCKHVTCKHGNL